MTAALPYSRTDVRLQHLLQYFRPICCNFSNSPSPRITWRGGQRAALIKGLRHFVSRYIFRHLYLHILLISVRGRKFPFVIYNRSTIDLFQSDIPDEAMKACGSRQVQI